jgi:hypothetical protein
MSRSGDQILKTLESGPLYTRQLAAMCDCSNIHQCLIRLKKAGLVTAVNGINYLTEAGYNAVKHVDGPCRGKMKVRAGNSLREKAWYLLRTGNFYSVNELMEVLCTGTERDAAGNLEAYLQALLRAGYLRVTIQVYGIKPERRYRLLKERNTGPMSPTWSSRARMLRDPNSGESYTIPARKKETPCEN